MQIITVKKNDAGQRLDKFLAKALPALPTSLLYKYLRLKKIKLNRKRAEANTVLAEGDELQLFIKDEFFEKETKDAFRVLTPRIDVVYEDENILLVNKRAGMIVHSDDKEDTNTLISHIQAYLYRKGEYDPDSEQSFAPALCNRIDRNTCGIVIAAKNAEALRLLNEAIKERKIKKQYLAAIHGTPERRTDTLTGFLYKDSAKNLVTVFTKKPAHLPKNEVKEIVTRYRVLEEKNGLSLVEVDLITGRTHQIRAHFSSIGHPLVGDGKYGVNKSDRAKGYKFQALCSYKLTFETGKEGLLADLSGKTFSIKKDAIWFVTELFPHS